MSQELKQLQAAQRELSRLQRSQQQAAHIIALKSQLQNMKREKVKLYLRMCAQTKRHAQDKAAWAREVGQLQKESRKNGNLIRSLKMKETVLRRKQEELSLLRRGHRNKLSNLAAGILHDCKSTPYREAWSRLESWVSHACAARCTLGGLEATLERLLQQREKARNTEQGPDVNLLRYLRESIADTQAQIMQKEDENDEQMLPRLLDDIDSAEAGRYSLERLAALTLQYAQDAAKNLKMLMYTREQLNEVFRSGGSLCCQPESGRRDSRHSAGAYTETQTIHRCRRQAEIMGLMNDRVRMQVMDGHCSVSEVPEGRARDRWLPRGFWILCYHRILAVGKQVIAGCWNRHTTTT